MLTVGIASPAAAAITWVTVGDAGNDAKSELNRSHTEVGNSNFGDGFGSVSYEYLIGEHMVTNSQYALFLNSVDAPGSNPFGIYNSNMESDAFRGGIAFNSGNLDGSKYSAISGREDWPVVYVSWFDAARFSNWMTNGMGSGDTENGAYTLIDGQTSETSGFVPANTDFAGMVRLPTENEWFKAAYYDPTYDPNGNGPGGYYLLATQSDTITTAQANYNNSVGTLTPVGSYGLPSFYGTFDQSGNAWEWNDAVIGTSRGLRGGSWRGSVHPMRSSDRSQSGSSREDEFVGFRVVMVAPEPGRMALLMMFGLVLLARRRR